MRINSDKVIKILEQFAPEKHAQSWDNVGFQIGNARRQIDKIMVALEVTDEVINEAIDQSVDLIIVHHPLLFRPLSKIVDKDPIGQMIMKLIENRINLIVAHTNLDSSHLGTNAYLADQLNLERISNLIDAYNESLYKFVIFVPADEKDKMIGVLEKAGAGQLKNYGGCTFSQTGEGTFRPLEGSNPYIGEQEQLERVEEVRIETIVEKNKLAIVLEKALKAHPYEVPAYDIIALENEIDPPNLGLVGYLSKAIPLEIFAAELKTLLGCQAIKMVASGKEKVFKVALCTGAGADLLNVAARKNADVYITGDLKYHEAQHAKSIGLNVIDAGHFETEQFYISEFYRILKERFEIADYDVRLIQSNAKINPFVHV
jgi:dinuclear metal center YbgI/SA1388 family protein